MKTLCTWIASMLVAMPFSASRMPAQVNPPTWWNQVPNDGHTVSLSYDFADPANVYAPVLVNTWHGWGGDFWTPHESTAWIPTLGDHNDTIGVVGGPQAQHGLISLFVSNGRDTWQIKNVWLQYDRYVADGTVTQTEEAPNAITQNVTENVVIIGNGWERVTKTFDFVPQPRSELIWWEFTTRPNGISVGIDNVHIGTHCVFPHSDFIGFSLNTEVGATSRGSLGNNAGEVMTCIRGSEYAGWGNAVPGHRSIVSLFFIAQDQLAGSVPGTFDIKLYPEDPANPGMPQTTAGVTFATGVTGPTGTGSPAAVAKTVTPAAPVAVPIQGGGDVFVAFALGPVTATQNMSIQIVLGFQPNSAFTVFDVPGSVQQPLTPSTTSNTHGVSFVNGSLVLNSRRMQFLDVAHTGAGGAVLTVTNQVSAMGSNNPPPAGFGPAPGTAGFMSGVAPDVTGYTSGRADYITFDFFRTGIGTGTLVFFLMDFSGNFGPEIPISAITPGLGVVCINVGAASVVGLVSSTADEAFLVTTIPAPLRSSLGGLIVIQQAAAIEASGSIVTSPCGAQRF